MSHGDSVFTRRQFAKLGATAALGLSQSTLAAQTAVPPLRAEFLMDLMFTGDGKGGGEVGPRRIANLTEGTFQGPKLKGKLVIPAGEWGVMRPDKAYMIDVRMQLLTDDDALIYLEYRGIRSNPGMRHGTEQQPMPAGREVQRITTPVFETASPKYEWLNRMVCVAVGYPVPTGVRGLGYHIYHIPWMS